MTVHDCNGMPLFVGDRITSNQFYGTGKVMEVLPVVDDGGYHLRVLHRYSFYYLRTLISKVKFVEPAPPVAKNISSPMET